LIHFDPHLQYTAVVDEEVDGTQVEEEEEEEEEDADGLGGEEKADGDQDEVN
jgi:hypothetical protein